jgi:hypothetical protein
VTRSFGQTNISWNDGCENLRAEEAAQVGGHLARERGALVIHREQDSFDAERRIQRAANAHQCIEKFGDAFESVVFALDRNEDGVAGDERIQRKQVQRGRAVNDDESVILFYSTYKRTQLEFAVGRVHQLDGSADEILIRGQQIEAFYLGFLNNAVQRLFKNKCVVKAAARGILRKADAAGRIALRVAVDEKRALLGYGER